MYDYDGSVAGSVPLVKDTIYYVLQINGKWGLVKTMDETQEGWSPIDYLQEESSPSAGAATQSYAPTTASSNPVSTASSNTYTNTTQATTVLNGSLGNGLADALKAKKSEETTLAGSLADALKKRQGVTRDDSDAEDDDDDDDW